jgi:alkylglycerol monooxygenase
MRSIRNISTRITEQFWSSGDRLFGTFATEEEPCVYGTLTPLGSWGPLWAVAHVYSSLAHDAIRTYRLRDKLRLWVIPTCWRPNDMRDVDVQSKNNMASSLDQPLRRTQAVFCLLQLSAMTALTAVLLSQANTLDTIRVITLCVGVAFGLWLAGAVMQRRLLMRFALPYNVALLFTVAMVLR